MTLRAAGLFGLLLGAGPVLRAADGPITLCEVKDGAENRMATIRGRLMFSMHGAAFLSESCDGGPQGVAVLLPDRAGAPAVEFHLNPAGEQRLRPYVKIAGGTITACGVLEGKLVRKTDFAVGNLRGGVRGNGFGYQGIYEWAFIVRSVESLGACAP